MLWSLANPLEHENIRQLLGTVCFRKIPQLYIKRILLPSIQVIFPDIEKVMCSHEHSDHEIIRVQKGLKVQALPGDIYSFNHFKYRYGNGQQFYHEFSFNPKERDGYGTLTVNSHGNANGHRDYDGTFDQRHSFVIFGDDKPYLPRYPIFYRFARLKLSHIKSLLKCKQNLYFMYFCRRDD